MKHYPVWIVLLIFLSQPLTSQEPETWGSLSALEDNLRIIESFELIDLTLRNELAVQIGRREEADFDSVLQWLFFRSFSHPEESTEFTAAVLLESRRKSHGTEGEKKTFMETNTEALRLLCTNFPRFRDSFFRSEILRVFHFQGKQPASILIGNCGGLYLENDSDSMKGFSDMELLAFIEACRLNPDPALSAAVLAVYQNSPTKTIHKKAYEVLLVLTKSH